ncbi:tRNA preQ1(34) S-adenosylmethionine ribosyltransferase-isomerase QueA [Comamonas flocculans]|uniref:S-adenosylmethionine:tRNA ribosyltransferase-isomerase n=1 Tax=Comamonas flocculans TaxID=2597701 RepID=A0A5B8RVH9_9BURK|nr:tRNA preQ1(34) S-adenosylmethionine ribosyltransferase-isomerase QueA [Comamonas flocculans]QEA13123.1 tRNA preQ1(34) S-adenosylmethionine ribosyltransferase-isomerase QueA [Comamonas flocculans]
MTFPADHAYTLGDFDFALPPELIAQHPAPERSGSRLLDGRRWPPGELIFRQLPALLAPGDLMVFNDTQVVKARLFGEKGTGGQVELLIERVLADGQVLAHMKVSKKPAPGARLHFAGGAAQGGFDAVLLARWPDARGPLFRLRLQGGAGETPWELMRRHGHLPLPPYIRREQAGGHDRHEAEDNERYQTIFAHTPGAVAAPTAALHFDEGVLAALSERGVQSAQVTLHVGAGTFQPVKTENIAEHHMHSEWYCIPPETLAAIARCRARGGRVLAIGTTTVRTLESWARTGLSSADTDIFITPGFDFRVVDLLVTNFHLPRSTLMMLVSAFAGYGHVMRLYRHAVAQRYRFFSYGDAMLLQRAAP